MRGSVGYDKIRKTWWWRFSYEDATGQRHYRRKRGFRTKREAQDDLNAALYALGKIETPPTLTLSQYLHQALEGRKDRLAPTTYAHQSRILDKVVGPSPLGRAPLGEVSRELVAAWAESLGQSQRSIETYLTAIKSLARPLLEEGKLPKGVFSVRTRREPRELEVWSPETTRKALEALQAHTIGPVVHLLVTTGLRAGEALALRWEDYDGEAVTVKRSAYYDETAGVVRFKETKNKQMRRVSLYPETVAMLEAHREKVGGEGLIFTTMRGEPFSPQALSSMFQWALAKYGIPKIRLHDLRHTAASHLLAARVPVPLVAQRLGHSSPLITLRVYAHWVRDQQNEAVRLGSSYLFGPIRAHDHR